MDCTLLDQAIQNLQLFAAQHPLLAIIIGVALWKWISSGSSKRC